jgi:two-component system NtrC family response regulator
MKRDRILVIDGNPLDGAALRAALFERGLDAVEATGADAALALVPSFRPGAVLADATLPGCDGPSLLGRLRELGSDAVMIAAAPHDRVEAALDALRAGAESFLVRPFAPEQARVVLEKALEKRRLRGDRAALRERVRARAVVVGSAPEMESVVELVRRVAPTKATVLVLGEAGAGKEHVAHALHEASPRRDRPFIRVNCAALSESLLASDLFGHEAGRRRHHLPARGGAAAAGASGADPAGPPARRARAAGR